jgi:putative oxidoreductase
MEYGKTAIPSMNPKTLRVLARVLIASVFVGLGAERLMAAAGWLDGRPAVGGAGIALAVLELLAGIVLMTGWHAGCLALAMAVFLLVDAFVSHPFWKLPQPEQHGQFLHFLKNLSVSGGLLLLFVTERLAARKPKP